MTKRSITIAGHRTSISLAPPFWHALASIAQARSLSLAALAAEIDRSRAPDENLSAAIRVFVLEWYRARAGDVH
jgi:predicted DNA-binding ribbon-helix-helix protein